jgi:imidazolonepropionase-like amidohydrolase
MNKFFIFCLTIAISGVFASDQIPGKKQDHPIALTGGTIHTVSGGIIEEGTVLFEMGKITAVGVELELPEGTEQINIKGQHVYPGLIAAASVIGLVEISAVRATLDLEETGQIKPNIRSETAVNPDSELFPVTRANGVTIAHVIPKGGLISGTSALIMMDGWTAEGVTLKAPIGLMINWPNMDIQRGPDVTKTEEEQVKILEKKIDDIRNAFTEARAYLKAKIAEKQEYVPYHASDIRWDAMIPVLNREIPVLINAPRIRQIHAAINWAEEENLKVVLMTGQDAGLAIDLLKEKNIPVILEEILTKPTRRWEPYDTPYATPAKLHEAGIIFCISGSSDSFEAAHVRNLPYHAAMAAAFGLPKTEALKSITLYPAQILGVEDQVGSIDIGKDATMIVTDGDPLEITTNVNLEFIQGRKIDLTSRHTQLYEKYKIKYEQLGLLNSGASE